MGDAPKKTGATDGGAAAISSLADLAAYRGPRETVSVETSPKIVSKPKRSQAERDADLIARAEQLDDTDDTDDGDDRF